MYVRKYNVNVRVGLYCTRRPCPNFVKDNISTKTHEEYTYVYVVQYT